MRTRAKAEADDSR